MTSTYSYDCFIVFNTEIDAVERELQLYAGRIAIEPEILCEPRFRVDFTDKNGLCIPKLFPIEYHRTIAT